MIDLWDIIRSDNWILFTFTDRESAKAQVAALVAEPENAQYTYRIQKRRNPRGG